MGAIGRRLLHKLGTRVPDDQDKLVCFQFTNSFADLSPSHGMSLSEE